MNSRRSFDQLVGAGEQRRRHLKAERPGGPEVDHKLIFSRCLHRQVGRLLAFRRPIWFFYELLGEPAADTTKDDGCDPTDLLLGETECWK
jgi:hypothetical protein